MQFRVRWQAWKRKVKIIVYVLLENWTRVKTKNTVMDTGTQVEILSMYCHIAVAPP